jgi:hypothetical protein
MDYVCSKTVKNLLYIINKILFIIYCGMEEINIFGINYPLAVLKNCNDNERYEKWLREGGTLRGNRNLGCGINSLTYLNVLTRKQGEALVDVVNNRGTTFLEMMNYVFNNNGKNHIISYNIPIRTNNEAHQFTEILNKLLCNNCCTIAKLTRYNDNTPINNIPLCNNNRYTSGHTMIFSKTNNVIFAIDPQQQTRRQHNINKAFQSWQRNCYVSVKLMFNLIPISVPKQLTVPMDIDEEQLLNRFPNHGPIQQSEPMDSAYLPEQTQQPVPMDIGGNKKYRKYNKSNKKSKSKSKSNRKNNKSNRKKTNRKKSNKKNKSNK